MSLNICTNFTLISRRLRVCSSRSQPKAQTSFVFSPLFFLLAVFQSKDIGIQMHEELVKVTNELYTVSNTRRLLQIDPPHLISCLRSATSFSSLCLSEILFHLLSFYSLLSPFFFSSSLKYLCFPLFHFRLLSVSWVIIKVFKSLKFAQIKQNPSIVTMLAVLKAGGTCRAANNLIQCLL